MTDWVYAVGDQKFGPHSEEETVPKFTLGSIFSETLDCFHKNLSKLCFASLIVLVLSLVTSLLPVIAPWIQGLLVLGLWKVVLTAVDGGNVEIGQLFSQTKYWRSLGLAVLALGITVTGFAFLLIIPGLMVGSLFCLMPPLVVDQDLPPFVALSGSYYLVQPHLLTWMLLVAVGFLIGLAGLACAIIGIVPALALVGVMFCVAYRRLVPRRIIK